MGYVCEIGAGNRLSSKRVTFKAPVKSQGDGVGKSYLSGENGTVQRVAGSIHIHIHIQEHIKRVIRSLVERAEEK